MTGLLLPNGKQQFLDDNGDPLVGGLVYFYVPGTDTPKDTYQDPDQGILNTNPVVLDSRGEAIVYGTGDYRQVLKDADENQIYDVLTQGTQTAASASNTVILECTVDGSGSVPSSGICGDLYVPFDCTLTQWVIQGIGSGSVEIDIWAAAFVAGTPPTVANSIVASAPPTVTSSQSAQSSSLTGWVTAISAGTAVRFNINSVSTFTHFTISLVASRSS